MRCLHKRPADRWQTARELLAELDQVVLGGRGTTREPRASSTEAARMPITEALARRIDREHFDPRMIGDALEYLDNQADSDVLVMLLNAVWLDDSDFEPYLRIFPYRCISPTPYGLGSRALHRFALSLRDHITLLSEMLQSIVEEIHPSHVIVVGFSASAELVLRLAVTTRAGARVPDGVLALGPNQGITTCFISRVLANLDSNDPAELLTALRRISAAASSRSSATSRVLCGDVP